MGLKDMAKSLQRDFVPGGKEVDLSTLKFRRTTEDEVLQCCASTSYDPQSGPIFCGKVAEFVARTEQGYVAICTRHASYIPRESRPE